MRKKRERTKDNDNKPKKEWERRRREKYRRMKTRAAESVEDTHKKAFAAGEDRNAHNPKKNTYKQQRTHPKQSGKRVTTPISSKKLMSFF